MCGASVSLSVGLGDSDWDPVCQGAKMIASFLGGVTLGTVLAGATGAWAPPAVVLLEALLLAGAALLANVRWTISTSILPVVAAMGVQNTVLQPVSGVRLGVTFITVTLASMGQLLGQALFGRAEPRRLGGHVLLWGALVAGATAGAILHTAFGPLALIVPAVLVTLLGFVCAVPVLARAQPHPARTQRFRWHVPPRKGDGQDGTGRRHGDPEPDHPSVWPYD
jgi:uncharacterized membrane protein YoaK (UPF0700 family)